MAVDFVLVKKIDNIVGVDTEDIEDIMDNIVGNTEDYLAFHHMTLSNLVFKVDFGFEVVMVAKVRVYSN